MSSPATRSASLVRAVSMMIGKAAVSGFPRSRRHTSTPLRTGRLRSRMTRSGAWSAIARSAVSPLPTTSTLASPERSSACLMRAAISCSSSTTRTLGTRFIDCDGIVTAFRKYDSCVKSRLRLSSRCVRRGIYVKHAPLLHLRHSDATGADGHPAASTPPTSDLSSLQLFQPRGRHTGNQRAEKNGGDQHQGTSPRLAVPVFIRSDREREDLHREGGHRLPDIGGPELIVEGREQQWRRFTGDPGKREKNPGHDARQRRRQNDGE